MIALVVLNERPLGSHPDVHEAFEALVAQGVLDGFTVYPYLTRSADGLRDDEIAGEIHASARDTGAHLLVWMHTGRLRIPAKRVDDLKRLPTAPVFLYWEGDSYHPRHKPLPSPMLDLMRRCDAVFMPCGGAIVNTLAKAGVTEVRYAPSCTSGTRFPAIWKPRATFDYDVVMIGNRVRSRVPFRGLPGARDRARLVRRLQQRYGRRFALVGRGWEGPSAVGPCAFDAQSEIYARSVVAIGVNNSTYPLVFSNRVPIAFATGIPLVYKANPGYDLVFGHELSDVFFDGDDDAMRRIDELLSLDASQLTAISHRNRSFFDTALTKTLVARHVVDRGLALAGQRRGETGGAPAQPIDDPTPSAVWRGLPAFVRAARGVWDGNGPVTVDEDASLPRED